MSSVAIRISRRARRSAPGGVGDVATSEELNHRAARSIPGGTTRHTRGHKSHPRSGGFDAPAEAGREGSLRRVSRAARPRLVVRLPPDEIEGDRPALPLEVVPEVLQRHPDDVAVVHVDADLRDRLEPQPVNQVEVVGRQRRGVRTEQVASAPRRSACR